MAEDLRAQIRAVREQLRQFRATLGESDPITDIGRKRDTAPPIRDVRTANRTLQSAVHIYDCNGYGSRSQEPLFDDDSREYQNRHRGRHVREDDDWRPRDGGMSRHGRRKQSTLMRRTLSSDSDSEDNYQMKEAYSSIYEAPAPRASKRTQTKPINLAKYKAALSSSSDSSSISSASEPESSEEEEEINSSSSSSSDSFMTTLKKRMKFKISSSSSSSESSDDDSHADEKGSTASSESQSASEEEQEEDESTESKSDETNTTEITTTSYPTDDTKDTDMIEDSDSGDGTLFSHLCQNAEAIQSSMMSAEKTTESVIVSSSDDEDEAPPARVEPEPETPEPDQDIPEPVSFQKRPSLYFPKDTDASDSFTVSRASYDARTESNQEEETFVEEESRPATEEAGTIDSEELGGSPPSSGKGEEHTPEEEEASSEEDSGVIAEIMAKYLKPGEGEEESLQEEEDGDAAAPLATDADAE